MASKAVTIDRWVACLAGAIVLLWLAWLLKGVHLVFEYISLSVPAAAGAGSVAPAQSLDPGSYLQGLGQVGDLFGGINALFAALACVGVVWAGSLQRQALLETREAYEFERDSIRLERDALARQQFESTFFQMLTLNRQAMDSIRLESSPTGEGNATLKEGSSRPAGSAALEYLASLVYAGVLTSQHWDDHRELVRDALRSLEAEVHTKRHSSLGPYFRSLFQALQFVDRMPVAVLSEADKVRYCNIARGQVPEGAVLLLALTGLTSRGQPFCEFIERYGLLEHMEPTYLQRVRPALEAHYRPQAFLGSKERATFCMSLTEKSL